jgi:hypothetical protein
MLSSAAVGRVHSLSPGQLNVLVMGGINACVTEGELPEGFRFDVDVSSSSSSSSGCTAAAELSIELAAAILLLSMFQQQILLLNMIPALHFCSVKTCKGMISQAAHACSA